MDKTLELFEYSSPLGLWRGLLFENKLAYFSRENEINIHDYAKSKNFLCKKIAIPPSIQNDLDQYFRGKSYKLETSLCILDGTEFEKKVWNCLLTIPYGQTRSYAWVAKQIKNPRAVRAVGRANGKNRIPILIPCHRVINANGNLGGYSGGIDIKKKLLELEAKSTDNSYCTK